MIAWTPSLGAFLTDSSGKTLYFFPQDPAETSICTDTCLARWPAFDAGTVVAPSVLSAGDFDIVSRADGIRQSSYKGRPLYYYSGDLQPGVTTGQGFNNIWSVAAISGEPVSVIPTPAPTRFNTLSPSGSGGY